MTYLDIPGFQGLNKVSNYGDILALERHVKMPNGGIKIIKQHYPKKSLTSKYYLKVMLTNKDGIRKGHFVHRLVMLAFVGASKMQVNHKDENKQNNKLMNLEYVTNRENTALRFNKEKTSSKYTGVTRKNSGWQAQCNGIYLGVFKTEKQANDAYKSWLND